MRRGHAVYGIFAAAVVGTVAAPALGQVSTGDDWREGRRLAIRSCQASHGMDGLSKLPEAPHIAAQPEVYLVAQILAFRGGQRQNEVMTLAARDLTYRQIADLAAHYAGIEIEVVRIPGRD